jgi:hypothetical protein
MGTCGGWTAGFDRGRLGKRHCEVITLCNFHGFAHDVKYGLGRLAGVDNKVLIQEASSSIRWKLLKWFLVRTGNDEDLPSLPPLFKLHY